MVHDAAPLAGPPAAPAEPPDQPAGRRKGVAGALKGRNYRLLLFGNGLSQAGDQMEFVARSWLMFQLTDSPFALGLMMGISGLPRLILAPLAGVLTDRIDRRTLLYVCAIANLVIGTLFATLALLQVITAWQVLVIVFVTSMFSTLNLVSRQALIPDFVSREDMNSALALYRTTMNTTQIVSQSLAGILIVVISVAGVLYLNAASYLFMVGALFFMRIPPAPPSLERSSVHRDLLGGIAFVWKRPDLSALVLLALLPFMFTQPYKGMLPIFADRILQVGPSGFGLMAAAPGLGGLIAGTLIATLSPRRYGILVLASLLAMGSALVVFAFSTSFLLSLAALAVVGAAFGTWRITSGTLLQLLTPREMMGRVLGIANMDKGMLPLGSTLVGFLAELIGVPISLAVPAVLCVAMALIVYARRPALRRL